MAAVKKNRRLTVASGELEAARGSLVGGLHLGNDARERTVAQAVLGHRQDVSVLRSLRIEDPVGAEPHLLQAGRIEIEPRQRPKHREAGPCCKSRCNSSGEQGRRGIVAQRRRSGCYLVQTSAIQAAIGKAVVERIDAERQRRPTVFLRER